MKLAWRSVKPILYTACLHRLPSIFLSHGRGLHVDAALWEPRKCRSCQCEAVPRKDGERAKGVTDEEGYNSWVRVLGSIPAASCFHSLPNRSSCGWQRLSDTRNCHRAGDEPRDGRWSKHCRGWRKLRRYSRASNLHCKNAYPNLRAGMPPLDGRLSYLLGK